MPAAYYEPAFAPDGKRLVAFRASGYERLYREWDFGMPVGADLVWLPAAGGEAQVIVPARGGRAPHFGPEADRVYWYQAGDSAFPRDFAGRLVSIRFDGTDRRTVFGAKGTGIYYAEDKVSAEMMRLSPDGEHVLYTHAGQLFLAARLGPWQGALEQTIDKPELPQVRLTDVGADHFGFAATGDALFWTVGHTLYRRDIDRITFDTAAAEQEANGEENAERDATNGAPDFASAELLENAPEVTANMIEVYRPRPQTEGRLALVGATAITMADEQTPDASIDDSVLLIENGRIAALGPKDEVRIPEDATVIDVSGRYLLPGYIDTHAHFRPLRELMDAQNWAFQANLAYGVTTGLDVQPSTVDIIAYEDFIDAGLMLGPRALSTGPGCSATTSSGLRSKRTRCCGATKITTGCAISKPISAATGSSGSGWRRRRRICA